MKINDYEDEFISIIHIKSKPKTEKYRVMSKCQGLSIGDIEWDAGWRRYVWHDPLIKLSDRCLFALGNFVKKLNEAHKK